jgi:hypothetical protein
MEALNLQENERVILLQCIEGERETERERVREIERERERDSVTSFKQHSYN